MDFEKNDLVPVTFNQTIDKNTFHDVYCFECHHEGDTILCDSCPRVYHRKCLNVMILPQRNWTCPECEATRSSFYIINQRYSIDELYIMLKCTLHRLKSHPQAESLFKSDYSDYIVHPMNFQIIEQNLELRKYNSIESFLSDVKWIFHNTFIHHGNQSKFTQLARTLLKKARHEMSEIEICPECYLRTVQPSTTDWFTKPCAIPHTVCWAKLRSYQFWPAKVLRVVNDEVDVQFFGQHDRAWVAHKNCLVLSKEYPGVERKKSNSNFDQSLAELQIHIDQLKKLYGQFTYAPAQTFLNRTKSFQFVSIIDDSILPSYIIAGNHSSNFHSKSHRCSNVKRTDKRSHESSNQHSAKRLRIPSIHTDDEPQWTLNVFDILNQPDQENTSRFRSTSPTDNKYRIQGLLRRYTHTPIPTIEPIHSEVTSSMNALLDAVEAFETTLEIQTDNSSQPPRLGRKHPRKSNSQHRILPQNNHSYLLPCTSLNQFLSPTLPFIPLRPLSVSPPSTEIFEPIPAEINGEIIPEITLRSEDEEEEPQLATQSSISINSLFMPSSIDVTIPLPTIIPSKSPIRQKNIWPSVLSIDSPRKPSKNSKVKRSRRPLPNPSFLATNIPSISYLNSTQTPEQTNDILLDDHQIREEIQMTINSFSNQFQQLLIDLTRQIDSSLRSTRMKYERDLEEIRRSYRTSLNDLHAITTGQVQEIHNSLELQYWQRLSEMRHRYESKLHYSLPLN